MHEIVTLAMGSLCGSHPADNGDFVRMVSQQRKIFSKLDTICFGLDCLSRPSGFGTRFGIESIQVRHTSGHVQVDDIFSFWSMIDGAVKPQSSSTQIELICPG